MVFAAGSAKLALMKQISALYCGLLLVLAAGFLGATVAATTAQAGQGGQKLVLLAPADGKAQPAPPYSFRRLAVPEQSVSPADWRGHKVFVNFFASWCGKCRGEHKLLGDLRAATTVPVIGISHLDRPDDTQKMLAQIGNPFSDVLEDKSGKGGRSWGLVGVPASFILDAQGQIVWQHHGPIDAAMLKDEILPRLATP